MLETVCVGLEEYQTYLRTSNLAETTKGTYCHYITAFLLWAEDQDLAILTACQVLDWVDLHQWADATRYSAATAIRNFYAWKFGAGHDVAQHARVKRGRPGPQRALDWGQLGDVLDSFDLGTPKGLRDRAMIALLVDTGLREAEICRAELRYWNRRKRKISVIVKGGDWGTADYFAKTAGYLNAWMEVRGDVAQAGAKTIFVSIGGNKPGTIMTGGGLRAVFRKIGQVSEIGAFSPHDCRRTFATLASLAGAPSRVVQVAGRWSSIEMVERYTRDLLPSDLEPYSPINNLEGKR